MDITWYGQACFRVKGKQATLVLDPFSPSFTGLKLPKLSADAVTISHPHEDHNFKEGIVESNPVVVAGPGEYEIKGIAITGVATFHDDKHGEERGRNTVYQCLIDNVSIVHLGDIGHTLTKEQMSAISSCDILMVPVGGVYTIDASAAAEVIAQLEPSIVLPMHYKIEGLKFPLDPIEKFLKVVGKDTNETSPKLTITKEKLPSEVEVVVLQKQ